MKFKILRRPLAAIMSVLSVAAFLSACTGKGTENETAVESGTLKSDVGTTAASITSEPKTLEEELLKRRGIAFDASDYKKVIGGEGVIDKKAEFDVLLDHGYSKDIDAILLSGRKIYRANFNTPLSNGKNVLEVGTLPGNSDVLYFKAEYDGENCTAYFKDNTAYKLTSPVPVTSYSSSSLDTAKYPLFKKVYRYSNDGKTLNDCTAEFLNADKIYGDFSPMIAFSDGRVSLIFSAQYLDKNTTGWNWYRDMGWREYIAFDLDLSLIGDEKPIRLFNKNILMTDRAFYEIVYSQEPLSDSDEAAQKAPDGSVSPYFPASQHLNCPVTLRKAELLSKYYGDVLNICTSHVITTDYTLLPVEEVMADGYGKYQKYDCSKFYFDYLGQ